MIIEKLHGNRCARRVDLNLKSGGYITRATAGKCESRQDYSTVASMKRRSETGEPDVKLQIDKPQDF